MKRSGVLSVAVFAATSFLAAAAAYADEAIPVATPPGVTLQSARVGQMAEAGGVGAGRQISKDVFADAKGMTLYTYDKDAAGKSACTGECVALWKPLLVSASVSDIKPYAGWSIATRDDGAKQWAFAGKPLYAHAKDEKIGDGKGNGADNGAWHFALFTPSEGLALPDGVAVQQAPVAAGEIFVAEASGTPLYTFDDDAKNGKPACVGECLRHWPAFLAAQLAKPVGDFTVVRRGDGVVQWAFRGKPLYTFEGDLVSGDVKGDGLAGKWHAAMLVKHFTPSSVKVTHNRYGGENFATAEGLTLYLRDRVNGTATGHNQRTGLKGNPAVGRLLGVSSCDAECTKTWRPLAAPADAQAQGYWDVVARPEGTKQWTYRGFPLYTYVGDKKPGDMTGNDMYEIMPVNDPYKVADVGIKAAGAMVWHTVTP